MSKSEMRIAFDSYTDVLPLSKLKRSKHQRNKHPKEQIERLAKIMREHGVRHPIHISKLSGQVCFGHGRWEAAKVNGWDKYPVIYQEFKDEDEEYACVQSDNAIAHWAELDLSAINTDLANLGPDFDIDLLGIKDFVLEPAEKFEAQCDEDAVPENADTRVKRGDVWALGRHRLMCGDSTAITDVERLMAGEKASLVHTDPPYNVDYSNQDRPKAGKTDLGRIENDKMSDEQFRDFLRSAMSNAFLVTEDSASLYAWYAWYASRCSIPVLHALVEAGWDVKQQLIWKKPMLLGRGKYQWAHEPCAFAVKGSPYFTSDRTKTTVWDFGGYDKSSNVHPTQKPVFIPEEAISNSSEPGARVLDLFGGSGSTLIACEKTSRRCFMMEIDPHYCDVILARWEKYTGQKAERLDEGKAKEENGQTAKGNRRKASKKLGGNKLLLRRDGSRAGLRRKDA